jgi:hypothetical protein
MRELVKSAKRDRRERRKEKTQYDHRTGHLIRPLANWCSRAAANGSSMARITSRSIICHDFAQAD